MNPILILLPEHAATFLMQFADTYKNWKVTFISNQELSALIRTKGNSTPVMMPEFPSPDVAAIEQTLAIVPDTIQLFSGSLAGLPHKVYVLGAMGSHTKASMVFTVRF